MLFCAQGIGENKKLDPVGTFPSRSAYLVRAYDAVKMHAIQSLLVKVSVALLHLSLQVAFGLDVGRTGHGVPTGGQAMEPCFLLVLFCAREKPRVLQSCRFEL